MQPWASPRKWYAQPQHRSATVALMETITFVIEATVSEKNSLATMEALQDLLDRVKARVPDALTTLTVASAPEATEASVTLTQS